MPRIRTIKPEFPQSESMGRVSREARLLFILLWTLADDSGRLRGDSRMLASLLYPYDDDAKKLLPKWLAELQREKCVVAYSADNSSYLQILNWLSHQKIDKPSASKIPPFDESSRILANPRERSSGDQGSRIKDQGRDQGEDQGSPELSSKLDPAEEVFEHWKASWKHPKAALDPKRRAAIKSALKGYSVADLCASISGYLNSPHHTGQNDRQTVYDDIGLLLRDAQHIDAGLRFADHKPLTSNLANHNVAILSDWKPPELRDETARHGEISSDDGESGGGFRAAALPAAS